VIEEGRQKVGEMEGGGGNYHTAINV